MVSLINDSSLDRATGADLVPGVAAALRARSAVAAA